MGNRDCRRGGQVAFLTEPRQQEKLAGAHGGISGAQSDCELRWARIYSLMTLRPWSVPTDRPSTVLGRMSRSRPLQRTAHDVLPVGYTPTPSGDQGVHAAVWTARRGLVCMSSTLCRGLSTEDLGMETV